MRQSSNQREENTPWRITKLIEFDVVFDWHAAIDFIYDNCEAVGGSVGRLATEFAIPNSINKIFKLIKTHYGPNATESTNAKCGGHAPSSGTSAHTRTSRIFIITLHGPQTPVPPRWWITIIPNEIGMSELRNTIHCTSSGIVAHINCLSTKYANRMYFKQIIQKISLDSRSKRATVAVAVPQCENWRKHWN